MQSRRSFLGLISAISAAVASGVRLPDAPEAKAAEVAPVKAGKARPVFIPERPKPEEKQYNWTDGHPSYSVNAQKALEANVRMALKDCVVVAHCLEGAAGELIRHRVTYKYAPGVKCRWEGRDVWEKKHMQGVMITESPGLLPDLSRGRVAKWQKVGPIEREIEITWIG